MTETVTLDEDGAIMLPASILETAGIKAGDSLMVSSDRGTIQILTANMALESVRGENSKQSPPGFSAGS